jgi:hypothetical protein
MIFLDTESVGFTGPPVLIQYQELGGEYVEFRVWENPVCDFLDLIESFLHADKLVIFNATHDSFVLGKWYAIFSKVNDTSLRPDPKEIRKIEEELDYSKIPCLKPNAVLDFYIILKQTLFNFAAGRQKRPLEVRAVPAVAAKVLKEILERFAVALPSILFEKFKNKMPGDYWEVTPNKMRGFVDFKLNFAPSLGLKSIIKFLFPEEQVQSIEIPSYHQPQEDAEYQPWNNDWPRLLATHLTYWNSDRARKYAKNDITYLIWLHKILKDKELLPDKVHVDSDLAWHTGLSRARGFCIDLISANEQLEEARNSLSAIPDSSSQQSLAWLREVCPKDYLWLIQNTDSKKTLIPISKMEELGECATRASKLIAQRSAKKRIDILEKLIRIGRFHPNFEVSGTLSNRMSGRGGINPQGIIRDRKFRELFLLADEDSNLSGGDFSAQEITILAEVVKDKGLEQEIEKDKKALHMCMARAIFGMLEEVVEGKVKYSWNEEYEPSKDEYSKAKNCVFGYVYGAQLKRLAQTAGKSEEQMQKAMDRVISRFPGLRTHAERIAKKFCSMVQPGGVGTQVEWHEPEPNATSLFGFSRSYILDNKICKFIFELASNPPKEIRDIRGRITRREREQSIVGATQSSLYATAFAMQAENLRTAGNHYIQSAGATVTKILQHSIWLFQPVGVAPWNVQLYNVHDELLCVNKSPEKVEALVYKTIIGLRKFIPLLDMDWKMDIGSWAEVKD